MENGEQLTFEFEQRPTIKGFPELRWTGKRPYRSTQYYPAQLRETYGKEQNGWINKIFWGDNLQVMSHLLKEYRGQIDLIYIDPPFDSKADYKKKIEIKGVGKAVSDSSSFEEKQYGDIWTNDEYLQFMYERILLLRELLSDTGSIFLHCDDSRNFYLRCLLSEVFGEDNFHNEIIKDIKKPSNDNRHKYQVRVLPPPRTITLKRIWHEYTLHKKEYSQPVDFKLAGADLSKYASTMYERDSLARDTTVKEKNIDYLQENMKYSEYSLAGEVARYLNISCILAAKILRESVDGADVILDAVNRYNAVLDDYIIPGVFHALFDITAELKTEDKELVLLREPKEAGYYEFSAKDDLVITNRYPGFTPDQIKKSFHADTYCFDSIPEKECFMQYITSGKVKEVYFTGMFTSNQGDLSVHYYDPESGRIRQYYPDFLAKMTDGSYQLIEVKGDNKIDDTVVKAKQAAAEEMAIASGIKYLMYAGSQIVNSHVLEDASDTASTISMC